MMYKKIAWYDCEEDERFSIDKLYDCMAEIEEYPCGKYVDDVEYNGKTCELYCEDDCDYTLYEVIEEDDFEGEMVDRRYQEYVDSKYEN